MTGYGLEKAEPYHFGTCVQVELTFPVPMYEGGQQEYLSSSNPDDPSCCQILPHPNYWFQLPPPHLQPLCVLYAQQAQLARPQHEAHAVVVRREGRDNVDPGSTKEEVVYKGDLQTPLRDIDRWARVSEGPCTEMTQITHPNTHITISQTDLLAFPRSKAREQSSNVTSSTLTESMARPSGTLTGGM